MAYTALQLISRAFFLSQIVSRELQDVSDDQLADGLYLLNALLAFKSTDLRLIPYFQRDTFNTVGGQEDYFVANLLDVDAITFNIGDVRYSMDEKTRDEYFNVARVDNVQSLPFSYRVERELGGARIYMYYVPQAVYVMKMSAKFGFSPVGLQTDLSLSYDGYFIEFLRYALAEYICAEYGATFPDKAQAKFEQIEKKLLDVSPPDLSIQSDNYFDSTPGMDWQTANLTEGYFP